ncbi:hypothetical protein VD792_26230, partial [Pseudomonas aeruginosa]|nr:hypothetical protein [Pseudomonas aeruginosa]MEB3142957.1 hypothetical protein [Pseudomonas aeruginosa]
NPRNRGGSTGHVLAKRSVTFTEIRTFLQVLSLSREMADEFTDNFNYPERQWDRFSSPERIGQWCSQYAPTIAA